MQSQPGYLQILFLRGPAKATRQLLLTQLSFMYKYTSSPQPSTSDEVYCAIKSRTRCHHFGKWEHNSDIWIYTDYKVWKQFQQPFYQQPLCWKAFSSRHLYTSQSGKLICKWSFIISALVMWIILRLSRKRGSISIGTLPQHQFSYIELCSAVGLSLWTNNVCEQNSSQSHRLKKFHYFLLILIISGIVNQVADSSQRVGGSMCSLLLGRIQRKGWHSATSFTPQTQ